MTEEARIEQTPHGKMAASDGWYVLHASEARWIRSERFGAGCVFEGEPRFPQLGIHLRVLEPGKPACLYHSENLQEAFYVISGECTLVVEEQERSLRAGHFFHCPPGTRHVFVGAGEGPWVVLMMGARSEDEVLDYPVSEAAAKHGASARARTSSPDEAYGDRDIRPAESMWPLYGID